MMIQIDILNETLQLTKQFLLQYSAVNSILQYVNMLHVNEFCFFLVDVVVWIFSISIQNSVSKMLQEHYISTATQHQNCKSLVSVVASIDMLTFYELVIYNVSIIYILLVKLSVHLTFQENIQWPKVSAVHTESSKQINILSNRLKN